MTNLEKKYWQIAQKASYFLQLSPFLKMVGINGSLARHCITKESDIDFIVISEKGRIWTCRFFVTAIITVLGLKRHGKKVAGRICLNRFITTESLVLFPYNEYHAKVYSLTVPTIDQNIYQKFVSENCWMTNYTDTKKINPMLVKKNIFFKFISKILELILNKNFGSIIEIFLKNYQIKKIKKHPLTINNKGLIIANDSMLCFHPTSDVNLTKIG